MRDEPDSVDSEAKDVMPISHRRVLVLMAILGIAGGIAGAFFVDIRSGAGFLAGTAIAFGSYFWLKHSLNKVFESTEDGAKPKISAIKYIARYFTLGIVVALVYATDIVPIISVLLGMAGFGFAVMADGLIRIFSSFSNRKDF